MSYVIVLYPEPREVLIDGKSQGSNWAASGRPRVLFCGAGAHTFVLAGANVEPASQRVTVPECSVLDPFRVEFKTCP